MKKHLPYLLIAALSIGIAQQLYVYLSRDSSGKGPTIPTFDIRLLNGSISKISEIGKNKHTLVFLYKSDCQYCQQEVRSIRNLIDNFSNTELIFLSFESIQQIQTFKSEFFPEHRPFVTFARTNVEDIEPILEKELGYPYLLWYDDSGSQKNQHRGLFPIERVIEIIASDT